MESLLEKDVVYHIFKHNVKTISNKIKVITYRKFSDDFFKENNETYDLIFIDADHSYDSVLKDIQNAKKFIKDDGIICGDDLNLQLDQVDMNFAESNKNKDFIQDPKTKKFSPRCHYGSLRIFWECEFMGWILGYSEVKFMLEKYIIS